MTVASYYAEESGDDFSHLYTELYPKQLDQHQFKYA